MATLPGFDVFCTGWELRSDDIRVFLALLAEERRLPPEKRTRDASFVAFHTFELCAALGITPATLEDCIKRLTATAITFEKWDDRCGHGCSLLHCTWYEDHSEGKVGVARLENIVMRWASSSCAVIDTDKGLLDAPRMDSV